MLPELTPAMQAEERAWQPQVGDEGLLEFRQFRVRLPELFLQLAKLTESLLAVLDQETAVVFTPSATS